MSDLSHASVKSFFSWILFLLVLALRPVCIAGSWADEGFHTVEKKGVIYKFSKADKETEYFITHDFPTWEDETFDVFELVKDAQGIAIDIGAWIGTTAIWLSKNFHHVIAVEADKTSLESIARNLIASESQNVTLCPFPVAETSEDVIFGPRGARLNESISCMKSQADNPLDYTVKSLTFKQILFDYVYSNQTLDEKRIAFVKCDIEGGEEDILEDVLHFAYNNKVPVYMSFHVSWWKSKKINDFHYLFKYFENNIHSNDLCSYIESNPFCSVLFIPKENGDVLEKKNITALIIGFNQPTYIRNMVTQLEKLTSDIVVVDNNSDSASLLKYYKNEFKHTLLRMKSNFGHLVYQKDCIQKLMGDLYILTDPDLQFSPSLPEHCVQNLIAISNYFKSNRVGFALLIDADDIRSDISCYGLSVQMWESEFWKNKLPYPPNPSLELFQAPIDTSFSLVNRRFSDPSIRVAGDYTCKHLPWHKNFDSFLEKGEYEFYLKNNKSTNWFNISQP